ncbi:MAG TPA: hypothetical protein VFG30_21410 [Polyangiales bacterium]|nr:hypothetical protein [Polyangiales bacterium]
MDVMRRGLVLLVTGAWLGCQGSNDMVLQADTAPGSGAGARSSAADGGGTAGASGAGTTAAGMAGAGGKPPAAASGGAGEGGPPSGSAGSGGGGSAGQSSAGTEAAAGSGETAGESGAAGTAGNPGMGVAGESAGEGGAAGEAAPAGAQDPDCDFNGIWVAKQVTVNEALGLPQSSNNWYYLEFKQSGTTVEVSRHFDCGIEVAGSATVTFSRNTLQALLTRNEQVGRKGTLAKNGSSCKFEMGKFWSVRGGDEKRFLPNGTRDSADSIAQVQAANPLPTPANTAGAVDTESDGKLGVAVQVSGIITGTRNSVQRDWTRWFTESGFEIQPSTDWKTDLTVRADFDNQESILDPTSGLLVSGSIPKAGAKHILKLRFLGRDASDPRVSAFVKATDVDTCFAIQDGLPAEQLE